MKKLLGLALGLSLLVGTAHAADTPQSDPIKIGWIDTYSAMPDVVKRARDGAQMAVDDFNTKGGFQGRNVVLIERDDRNSPPAAIQIAQDLVNREKVTLLAGTSFGGISKAIYEFAQHQKIPYFAAWCSSDVCPKQKEGVAYTFTFEEPYDQSAATLAKQAATYPIKKWAVVRYNDAWDFAITEPFIAALKKLRPDVEIVQTITVPGSGTDQSAAIIQSLKKHGAEGVYITLYGQGLASYLRQARARGFYDKTKHIAAYLPPENMAFLGNEAPAGWYATGYPEESLQTPENLAFINAFKAQYKVDPGLAGLLAYATTKSALQAMKNAGSLNAEAIVKAAENLTIETPVGPMRLKAADHRADFTYWYGTIDVVNGKPIMKDFIRGEDKVQ